MKKNFVVIGLMILVFFVSGLTVMGDSNDDYKVIKKAVKGKKHKGDISWFKVSVINKRTKKSQVSIKLPFSLIELLAGCSDDEFEINDKCNISLKKIVSILKEHGPMTMIEVDEDDELVKIWFE